MGYLELPWSCLDQEFTRVFNQNVFHISEITKDPLSAMFLMIVLLLAQLISSADFGRSAKAAFVPKDKGNPLTAEDVGKLVDSYLRQEVLKVIV